MERELNFFQNSSLPIMFSAMARQGKNHTISINAANKRGKKDLRC